MCPLSHKTKLTFTLFQATSIIKYIFLWFVIQEKKYTFISYFLLSFWSYDLKSCMIFITYQIKWKVKIVYHKMLNFQRKNLNMKIIVALENWSVPKLHILPTVVAFFLTEWRSEKSYKYYLGYMVTFCGITHLLTVYCNHSPKYLQC